MDVLALIDDPKMRTLLIAAATIAAVFVLLRIMRGLARGDTGSASRGNAGRPRRFGEAAARDSLSEVPPAVAAHQRPERPQALDDWEVRMHETARELIGRIDAKLAALQALTLDADRAAARLEQALAAAARSAAPAASDDASKMSDDAPAASGVLPVAAGAMPSATGDTALLDAAAVRPLGEPRRKSVPVGDLPELSPEGREPHVPQSDQADALRTAGDRSGLDLSAMPPNEPRRHEEVYLLADYGFGPAEIAHRTGVPIGEVELILRLREKS